MMCKNIPILIILLLWRVDDIVSTISNSICYSDLTDPYSYFSTKTGYFVIDNEDITEITVEGCEIRSLWFLARHGTRNPGKKDLSKILKHSNDIRSEILDNHDQGRGELCDKDLELFRSWQFNLNSGEESLLTESGRLEHYELGRRFKKRLPHLIGGDFNTKEFLIRHTHKSRTEESAKSFARGAFPNNGEEIFDHPDNVTEEDQLLRFYEFCHRWLDDVDENDATYSEQKLFLKTAHVTKMVENINRRLGFSENRLNLDKIFIVYDICRFEKAWFPGNISIWCSAFDGEDLEVLEYHEELKYWYNAGYYYSINNIVACPLMQDLVEKFGAESFFSDDNKSRINNATFYFSHSEALLPFLTLLGLYRDEQQLTHKNFDAMKGRKYRTSKIGAFSSNIAFLLLDCNGRKKVQVMHQEEPVKLEHCDDVICDWDKFLEIYHNKINCNFQRLCSLDEAHVSRENDLRDLNQASANHLTFSSIFVLIIIVLINQT